MSDKLETYKKVKLLGEGSFGKAFLVETMFSKEYCVIKQVNISNMSEKEREVLLEKLKSWRF